MVRRLSVMLLMCGVALPCAVLLAQGQGRATTVLPSQGERLLTGFRYLWIEPPTYDDGRIDYMNLKGYFEKQLADQSWVFLTAADVTRVWEDTALAGATLKCSVQGERHVFSGGASVTLRCSNLLGREMVTITERGRMGFTYKGLLEAAIRDVAKKLALMHPRFDPTHSVDLSNALPPVETIALTEEEVDSRIASRATPTTPQRPPTTPATRQPTRPATVTAFKTGERMTGMTKQCFYDGLGSTYTRTISAVALCPLSISVSAGGS